MIDGPKIDESADEAKVQEEKPETVAIGDPPTAEVATTDAAPEQSPAANPKPKVKARRRGRRRMPSGAE